MKFLPDIKKMRSEGLSLSLPTVVNISFAAVLLFGVAALALDGFIFYRYGYTVINEQTAVDLKIRFKRGELTDLINILDRRAEESKELIRNAPITGMFVEPPR